ncbi:MAG: hypothetical protein ACD_40C00017G0002 [uncultured bacterium]|nr:MAG: hypothetical protein ACD_40C00017G0002 [uncultured bacterium]
MKTHSVEFSTKTYAWGCEALISLLITFAPPYVLIHKY